MRQNTRHIGQPLKPTSTPFQDIGVSLCKARTRISSVMSQQTNRRHSRAEHYPLWDFCQPASWNPQIPYRSVNSPLWDWDDLQLVTPAKEGACPIAASAGNRNWTANAASMPKSCRDRVCKKSVAYKRLWDIADLLEVPVTSLLLLPDSSAMNRPYRGGRSHGPGNPGKIWTVCHTRTLTRATAIVASSG
jgi:hypothetical protein